MRGDIMSEGYLSTTALSRALGMKTKVLFDVLAQKGYIVREGEVWIPTYKSIELGAVTKNHHQYGEYIAWKKGVNYASLLNEDSNEKLLSATSLGKQFGISKFRINPTLSELGLIEKIEKGWNVTKLGQSYGGRQLEDNQKGTLYVCWAEGILANKTFLDIVKSVQGTEVSETSTPETAIVGGFREKFEAKLRTTDGHYVRSRAEIIIDNWLYMSELVHAYERKLPISEEVYCDFYLPVGKVYIEYWGMENDERYRERKRQKLEIYRKYGFNLIELIDSDIQNLDDIMPIKLLKFGIQTY
jgi:hypothetical protein